MLTKNVLNWFQIPTSDLDRAAKFYSAVLGREVKIMDFKGLRMGFFDMKGPAGEMGPEAGVGGALIAPMEGDAPSGTGTIVFLSCDGQLDAAIARVEPAGGTVLRPKDVMGAQGAMAIIKDTEGNRVGLHAWN